MAWTLGILVALGILGALGLQFAIARDGPGVLSAVDWLTGGDGGAELKATISTGEHPQQKLLVWGPQKPATSGNPVLVFAHGGSWRSGDPASYDFIGRAFVEQGFVVVLVGYRLGEAGIYPAMLEDTARAVRWTHEEIAAYGGDPGNIVLAGHSAGAYNVTMAALERQWLEREGVPEAAIKGVIGLSGPYDFAPFDSDSTIAAFGHVEDPAITQPVTHVRKDAPQMLLIHGEKDTLVRPRNTQALSARLKDADGHALPILIPGMEHNDPLISLAAPWRSRRDVIELVAGFAHGVTGDQSQIGEKTSVPVQAQTR